MTDAYDRAMIALAARRGPVWVRCGANWAPATLHGWHPDDTTRGANARIRYTTGRTRTVRCADIALTEPANT